MNRIGIAGTVVLFVTPLVCGAQEETATSAAASAADAVPAYVLELPETVSDVLIAETDAAVLHRFGRTESGIVRLDQRYVSIGQNGVGKQRAWDRRTPLGVYFITGRLDTSNLDDKYGVAAYPLDYPNAWDRYNGRTGNGIWLHGVDENGSTRPPRDTDGCLALPNHELLSLGDTLKPFQTPVIVARELAWAPRHEVENTRREFRNALEAWRQSLEANDMRAYLSLYADDFRYRGMNRTSWASHQSGLYDAGDLETVDLENVLLMADPEEAGLYLSRFTQALITDGGAVEIEKRLYWRRREADAWQIVAEDSG